MDDQPKYQPQAASDFFYSGSTSQPPVPGTLARGELRENEEFYTGRSVWGLYIENPMEIDQELLARGKERYQIYCQVCHGERGDGKGMLFERSKILSGNLHDERIRSLPDGRIYYVLSNGTGLMPGYRYPIPPRDRWAIVAYVRELQLQGNR